MEGGGDRRVQSESLCPAVSSRGSKESCCHLWLPIGQKKGTCSPHMPPHRHKATRRQPPAGHSELMWNRNGWRGQMSIWWSPPLFPWRCQQVVCTSLGGGGGVGAKESKLLLGPNQSPPHNNSTVCARTCTCGGGRGAGVDKELLRGRKDDRCASGWSSFYKAGSSPNVKLLLQDRLLLHGLLYGPAHTNTQQFVSVFHCTLSKSLSLNPKQIAAANNIDYFARFSQ